MRVLGESGAFFVDPDDEAEVPVRFLFVEAALLGL
jgi:hypothetical protein